MDAIITFGGVSRTYEPDGRPALDAVDLEIEAGRVTAVMGPSGGGKSTLLNLIGALDRPTAGRLVVAGNDVTRLGGAAAARFRRSTIGLIFQFFHLIDELSVIDNVALPARLAGMPGRAAHERARTLLDQLGIGHAAKRHPTGLSGGERQRVAIARAVINRPPILLADEPTGALDRRSGEGVMDLLADLNRLGHTVVLVTHDPRLAEANATRIVQLVDGRITGDRQNDGRPR
jgi:putative ABC transport system ATP-binding protein